MPVDTLTPLSNFWDMLHIMVQYALVFFGNNKKLMSYLIALSFIQVRYICLILVLFGNSMLSGISVLSGNSVLFGNSMGPSEADHSERYSDKTDHGQNGPDETDHVSGQNGLRSRTKRTRLQDKTGTTFRDKAGPILGQTGPRKKIHDVSQRFEESSQYP